MGQLTENQLKLFNLLHQSRLDDLKTFKKKSYRGVWSSIIDKYPESAHFIYELLQNADDAGATEVYIVLKPDRLLFKHNGSRHFDVTDENAEQVGDINSITGIGDSSKTEEQNKIGKFGVGFKAVFQYTDVPEIYDDNFKFKIENYIVPTLLSNDHPDRKEGETLFVFPFKNKEKSYKEIWDRLQNLQSPILFLRCLKKIIWREDGNGGKVGVEMEYKKELIEKQVHKDIIFERYILTTPLKRNTIFLFSQTVSLVNEEEKIANHYISVGYYYDEIQKRLVTKKQNVFCFFPTIETFDTCFVSHAPFLLTDNRQNLKPSERLNVDLVRRLADLASDALVYLKDYGIHHHNLLINENITEIIPTYTKHYWSDSNKFFEAPMEEAFENALKHNRLLLSRNNQYLSLKEAYIGSPRELVDLLSQHQFSLLKSCEYVRDNYLYEKANVDFLKWELSQNINKSENNIYSQIRQYTSENFAQDLTPDFMKSQDIRWVTRMYTFLRTAAPKLWKITDKDKTKIAATLPFRKSPIIKTQKGEWISPYNIIDGITPNVFYPLKKNASSEYNFISEEYLENEMAKKFFDELELSEPDEYDYIRTVIFQKFVEKKSAKELDVDFEILVGYYLKVKDEINEKEVYLSLLNDKLRLMAEDGKLYRPCDLYWNDKMLKLYFKGCRDIAYFDFSFYQTSIERFGVDRVRLFTEAIGVHFYPQIQSVQYDNLESLDRRIKEVISNVDYYEFKYVRDYELEGFSLLCNKELMSKEISIYIWNQILSVVDLSKYSDLQFIYRRKHARHASTPDCVIDTSTFKYLLLRLKWLYDKEGRLVCAENIFLEDLAPEYILNDKIVRFIGIEKKEKSIIELGGTDEQQNYYDLGKLIDNIKGDLTEYEILQLVKDASTQKKSKLQESINPKETTISEISTQEENIEDKLKKKWEKKANESIGKPRSSTKKNDWNDVDNPQRQPTITDSALFNDNQTTSELFNYLKQSEIVANKLKSKNEKAKEYAEKTSELVEIFDLFNATPKYTYKWYKLLMELMHTDKQEVTNRHIQIDFSEWSFICSGKVLHLYNSSIPVPSWCLDADKVSISIISDKSEKVEGCIVKLDDSSMDLSIVVTDKLKFQCEKAKKIRVIVDSQSNIIDSLEKRFLQLGFDDDYDLNANLPTDIQFIYGPPGTGKTTKLVKMLHDLVENSKGINILVLTPTNKAADVIARKLVDDELCYNCLTRFGATESLFLIEEAAVVTDRNDTDMTLFENNILVTTAVRYAYDYIQPDDTFICDFPWDYIVIDEASMLDIITMTFVLYKGGKTKYIISGDPKQIQPVAVNDIPAYNIYDMVDLNGFYDAVYNYKRYPVIPLMTQYRSIRSIGDLVSKFAYNGIVKSDLNRSLQKSLVLDGIPIKDINCIGFEVIDLDSIKELSAVNDSAIQLYSVIFTYNMVEYIVSQIQKKYDGKNYTIGIVCPYRAEADAIKQMLDNRPLATEYCHIICGTVHSFQGDECDIMFVVLNPPAICTSNSHINNENILNVAMSRARDYLFFILPRGQQKGFTRKNDIGHLLDKSVTAIFNSDDIEKVIFGDSNYIYTNTHVTCHLPINVYCEDNAIYEVRMSDDALDIKINRD